MFVIEEKPWIQFLKFLILKRLCHCNVTCFLNYTWIKETGIWLVNSHTPLTVTMESDWATVKHISAVLRPDWSTERSLQFLYMRKVKNQINECNIGWKKTVKSLRRHIVIFNFSFVKTLFSFTLMTLWHHWTQTEPLLGKLDSTLEQFHRGKWMMQKKKRMSVRERKDIQNVCYSLQWALKCETTWLLTISQKKHTDEWKTVPVQYNAILTEKQKKQKCSIKFNNK